MKLSDLILALQARQKMHGDREVLVHCGGCCLHAHEVLSTSLGGQYEWPDEAESIVIEVE